MEFEYVYSNIHIGEIINEYAFYRVLHVAAVKYVAWFYAMSLCKSYPLLITYIGKVR